MVETGARLAKTEATGILSRFCPSWVEFRITRAFRGLCGDGLVTPERWWGGGRGGDRPPRHARQAKRKRNAQRITPLRVPRDPRPRGPDGHALEAGSRVPASTSSPCLRWARGSTGCCRPGLPGTGCRGWAGCRDCSCCTRSGRRPQPPAREWRSRSSSDFPPTSTHPLRGTGSLLASERKTKRGYRNGRSGPRGPAAPPRRHAVFQPRRVGCGVYSL